MSAALAYYSVLSLPPLLVIVLANVGMIFGAEAAQGELERQLSDLLGDDGSAAIHQMISRAERPAEGALATLVGVTVLLFGASGVFGELQGGLNTIWGVEPEAGRGIWGILRDRFLSFTMVLGMGFLLLVSLAISATLSALGKWMGGLLSVSEGLLQALNFVASFSVIALLFALIFKILPDAKISWRDVWIGAVVTALLFTVGKFAMGLYLGRASIGTAYGAAGSLIVALVWIYYSAQILYTGAVFTKIYAASYGSRIQPPANAKNFERSERTTAAETLHGRAMP